MTSVRYTQIVQMLLNQRRELKSPVRLPDEHTLAAQYSVARDTVRRALRVLEEQEAVVRRPRRGTYLQPLRVSIVESLKGKAIGFVPPWWADSTTAWHTSTVFEGISKWADEQACHISVLHAQEHPVNEDDWLQQVRERKVVGLIWLNPQSQQMPLVRRAAKIFPVVVAGRCESGEGIYSISPDWEQAAQLLDDRLVSLGHTTYAVLAKDIISTWGQTWVRALTQVYAKRSARFDHVTQFIDPKPFSERRLSTLLFDVFMDNRTTVQAFLLTSSSYLEHLTPDPRFRERLGRDISIVTTDYGLYPMQSYLPGVQFDHVTCDWPEVGRQAASRLAQVVAGQDVPYQQTLPVRFVPGQSCAPFKE